MSQNQLLPLASPVTNRHFQRYVCMYITYVPFTSSVFWIPPDKDKTLPYLDQPFQDVLWGDWRDLQFFEMSSRQVLSESLFPDDKKFLPYIQPKSTLSHFQTATPCPATSGNNKKSFSIFLYISKATTVSSLNFPFFKLKGNMKGFKAGFWQGHISSKCALKVAHVKSWRVQLALNYILCSIS